MWRDIRRYMRQQQWPGKTVRNILLHPANRGHRLQAVARYLGWQVHKRMRGAPTDVPFHGLVLRCYPDSHSASAAIYFSGLPDYREMRFLQRYLRAGDVFVDVGANVGLYTLLAASLVGKEGVVHAFEPGRKVCQRLRENVALNGLAQVRVHELAVSDRDGPLSLSMGADDCMNFLTSDSEAAGAPAVAVQGVTLDAFLGQGPLAMAKLDIEGAEPLAIRGASGLMRSGNPPVVQVEMDGFSDRYGMPTHQTISLLRDLGYDVGVYQPEQNRILYTDEPWKQRTPNVLAVHRGRRQEVEQRLQS